MRLPNREDAWIHPAKLTDYLLSETHAEGAGKAKLLRRLGFDESNVDMLEDGLLAIARTEEVAKVETTRYGTKYVIYGTMATPAYQKEKQPRAV